MRNSVEGSVTARATKRCRAALACVSTALALGMVLVPIVAGLLVAVPEVALAQVDIGRENWEPEGGGCVAPTVDGDLTDLEAFANCLTPALGCGFVVPDPAQDICAPNSFVPCNPTIACPTGGASVYFSNGADLILAIFAYDRATDTFYYGARVVSGHAIGDADGGGTSGDDCGSPGNIIDQAGIGLSEPYNAFIDTNCDDKPEFLIEVSGNALKLNGVAVPGTDGGFATSGSNLELFVEGLGLPPVVRFFGQAGFSFDGLEEDKTQIVECPTPDVNIDVLCAGPTALCAGESGDFSVTVTNIGEVDLASVSATATIPVGLNFDQILSSDNFDNCSELGGVITCTESSLPVGGVRTLSFRVIAKPDCFGDVTIATHAEGVFSQAGCVEEVGAADNSDCPVTCQENPDVECRIDEAPAKVCDGTLYTVSGVGINASLNKTLSIEIRRGGTLVASCAEVGPGGTCPFSEDFTASCPTGGTINHTYVVSSENSCDSDQATCPVQIECNAGPDVSIDVVAEPGKVCPSETVTLTATATNNSSEASNIVIKKEGIVVQDCGLVAPGGTCEFSEDVVIEQCPGFDLASGGSLITFCYTAEGTVPGCPGTDTDEDCADVECNTPDVDIEKVVEPESGGTGDPFTVTLTITNTGQSVLDPVEVCDALDSGVGFDQGQVIGGTCGVSFDHAVDNKICFTDFSLDPGQSCTIIYEVTCDEAGDHPDTATVVAYCDGVDQTPENVVTDSDIAEHSCGGGACPRTPGFWTQQCLCAQGEGGRVKFSCAEMDLITGCIDATSSFFNWTDDRASFCAIINPPTPMQQRQQAKRQFAAFLANVCTGNLAILANNGDIVSLPLSTPISGACAGLADATTVGDLIPEVDALLTSLEGQSLDDPEVKEAYGEIITCLDRINNGVGIPFDPEACVAPGNSVAAAFADRGLLSAAQTDVAPTLEGLDLFKPTPNPFRQSTRMAYAVSGSASAQVEISVYNTAGQRVRTLVSAVQAAGRHEATWDGRDDKGAAVPAGVYFYRAVIGGQNIVSRVVLVK